MINSFLFQFKEISRDYKHNYRHDRLRRGVCLSNCQAELAHLKAKAIESLESEKLDFNNFPPILYPAKTFRNDGEYREKYGKIMNICMNQRTQLEYNLSGYTHIEYCVTKHDNERDLDFYDAAFLLLVKFIVSCVVLSSVYDEYLKYKEKSKFHNHFTTKRSSRWESAILSFSIIRNWKKFVSPGASDDHKSIHAIKVIYCFIIAASHVLMFCMNAPQINKNFNEMGTWSWLLNFTCTASVVTTSFFLITGFVMAYAMFTTIDTQPGFKGINMVFLVIRRYLRYVFKI